MDIKIIALLMMSSGIASAEYRIMIPLEPEIFLATNEVVAPSNDFVVTPTVITRGNSASLNWSYDNLDEIRIQGESYSSNSRSGAFLLSPMVTTTYTVLITKDGNTTSRQVTVNVTQETPSVEFAASAYTIGEGDGVNLTWNTEHSESVEIQGVMPKTTNTNSSITVHPTETTTYLLIAYGYDGQTNVVKVVTIVVEENAKITSYSVDKNKVSVGDSAMFSWDTFKATAVTLNGESQSLIGSKSVTFPTPGNQVYTLSATSSNGLVISDTQAVDVYALPIITNYKVNGTTGALTTTPGKTLTFTWTADGTSTYKLNNVAKTGGSAMVAASPTAGVTNYVLLATNPAGGTATSTIPVTVEVLPPTIDDYTAPIRVFADFSFTVTFTTSNSTANTIEATGGSDSGLGFLTHMGTTTTKLIRPNAAGSYTYTIRVTNSSGLEDSRSFSVVVEDPPVINSFTTSSSNVKVGTTFDLSWNVNRAENMTIDNGVGFVTGLSKTITAPATPGSVTYKLTNSHLLNGITKFDSKTVTVNFIP